jgi:uncharacterized protein with FMN-binding domain
MRRSPIVLTATVAGTAAVLAFHPHGPTVQTATASPAAATPTSARTSSGSGSGSGSGSSNPKTTARTATGDPVATQYGDAQVRVTVENGRIVKVQALQLQGNDPRSVEISSSAEPILRQEVLAKQTANVDAVSGATFTSASYTQSLQSALDKLGFKAADGSRGSSTIPDVQEHDGGPGGGDGGIPPGFARP